MISGRDSDRTKCAHVAASASDSCGVNTIQFGVLVGSDGALPVIAGSRVLFVLQLRRTVMQYLVRSADLPSKVRVFASATAAARHACDKLGPKEFAEPLYPSSAFIGRGRHRLNDTAYAAVLSRCEVKLLKLVHRQATAALGVQHATRFAPGWGLTVA